LIFVTVGTHEQQFNRLIEEIDRLKGNGIIKDEVVMQTGYCTYEPKYCTWSELLPYDQMLENVEKADIVITHGGPSSFIMPLQIGKIPIVVPRRKKYDEHVNNHQVEFATAVKERYGNIIVVKNIKNLEKAILKYDRIVQSMSTEIENNNEVFNEKLGAIVEEMFE
jgi:UDP-N-acetylglucosamine transferase subunit ALG13